MSSVTAYENRMLVRVFNAENDRTDITLKLGFSAKSVTPVSPDGSGVKGTPFTVDFCDDHAVIRDVPRFGIRTIAIEF